MTAPTVKVKPMVWCEPARENNWTHGAKTIVGTYYVHIDGGKHQAWLEWFEDGREDWVAEPCSSLQAAKAAAQADYEARILSAIDTTDLDAHIGAVLAEAAAACEAQKAAFLDPAYATPQPMGSFSERFACDECAFAILALRPTALTALDRAIEAAILENNENNEDWFGVVHDLWGWILDRPGGLDAPIQEGSADAVLENFKTTISAMLREARVEGMQAALGFDRHGIDQETADKVCAAICALIEAERGKP